MNIYDKILISLPEYNFFRELRDVEKIQYLLEVYDIETKRNGNIINGLNNFFDDISDEDFEHGIESNSLKALRSIAYKFMDGGYIISRDKNTEKLFVKDKITRYLRVFKILGQSNCLCYN